MSGFHADPDGNIYAEARQRIALDTYFITRAKRLPGVNCHGVAAAIVRSMSERDLHLFVHAPEMDVTARVHAQISDLADWESAHVVMQLFAEVGRFQLDRLPSGTVTYLACQILSCIRDNHPGGDAVYIWPNYWTILDDAKRWAGMHRPDTPFIGDDPVDVRQLEAALLPLVGGPLMHAEGRA